MEDWTKKWQEGFLTALATAIMQNPRTSIKKPVKKLKVSEKTVRTAIQQDSSPNLNPFDYDISGFLENKTNATSHRNIGSLNIEILVHYWWRLEKMPKNLFWRRFEDVLIQELKKKLWPYSVNLLILLFISKIKINLVL